MPNGKEPLHRVTGIFNWAFEEREFFVIHERGIPDNDQPVVPFICHHAYVSPEEIISLRVNYGWSWSRICAHYRIPPTVFYIRVESYGPPGYAYGHYRHYPHRGDWERIRITDPMIVNQVNLIFISKYYDYPPERVIRMREQGSSFGTIERRVYREREYQARGGVPPQEMRRSGTAPERSRPGTSPIEMRVPQRWKEIPDQGVRPSNARFQDVYPSISHPSQRPEVKGRYSSEERGQGRGQGNRDKRDRD